MSREGWVVQINIDLERELFDGGGVWIPPHRGWGRRLTELLEVAFGRPLAPVNARGWSAADRLKRRYVWDVERALWVAGQVCGHSVEFYTQEEAERVAGLPPSAEDRDRYDGTEESVESIRGWLQDEAAEIIHVTGWEVTVATRGQWRRLLGGDWLARDQKGRLLVIDDDDIAENYEREGDVDEQAETLG